MLRRDLLVSTIVGTLASVSVLSSPAVASDRFETVAVASGGEPVKFSVFLPLRNTDALERLIAAQTDKSSPHYHQWLTPDEFKAQFGGRAEDFAAMRDILGRAGFGVVQENAQSLDVTGTAAAAARLFSTSLHVERNDSGRTRIAADREPTLPDSIRVLGARVVGLDHRLPMSTMSRRQSAKPLSATPRNRYSAYGDYWYNDLKQAYHYPAFGLPVKQESTGNYVPLSGRGANMAVVISSDVLDSDVEAYFKTGGVLSVPKINRRPLSAFYPGFSTGSDDSFEASLDIQMTLGSAPRASDTLYIIDDLYDSSIIAGYTAVVQDNAVDVVNSSFGECEQYYAKNFSFNLGGQLWLLAVYDSLFAQGNAQGITFVASSGDEGGAACAPPAYFDPANANAGKTFQASVGASTPASSPHVTAVGGTNLETTYQQGSLQSAYVSENAKGDKLINHYDPYGTGNYLSGTYWGSGGGLSTYFSMPSWQAVVATGNTAKRSVPDISMHMGGCPGGIVNVCHPGDSADILAFGIGQTGGGFYGVIGTSASSPEFVGVLALLIQKTGGRVGNANPYIYNLAAAETSSGISSKAPFEQRVFNTNVDGYNGFWYSSATLPYNHVIGNGTPVVYNFLGLPHPSDDAKYAGTPESHSNP